MAELFVFPLSADQQRLWITDQLAKGTSAYNITSVARLTGPLNVAALERSLEEVVLRHENLRTRFAIIEREPVQIVSQEMTSPLIVRSLAELPESQREERVLELRRQEAQWSFDLEQGPLVRTSLLKLSEREHMLLFTMHHIVGDAWSMRVLTREVIALYEAFDAGMPSQLKKLPLQYGDFSVWQQDWLQEKGLETELSYWKQKLQNLPPVLELPIDHPRPAAQSDRGSRESLLLGPALTGLLDELTRQEGLTMFMTMLAAFDVLLYRYSGREDIFVGTPISGRNRAELEMLVGFLVNTLVIRTDLSGDPSFRDTLKRVKQVVLEAHEHKDLPFVTLVEHLQPERNLSHTPLFQVMFTYEKDIPETDQVNGLELNWLEAETTTAKFELTMSVAHAADGLKLGLEYNTDLYDATSMRRMLRHYVNLLESATREPDLKLWELEMLSSQEREQVLVEWNLTARAYERESTIQDQFYEQARRRRGEAAIESEGEVVSYEELNRRTNQLAKYLRKRGVREEARVGILEERGLGMVEEMLGIVKAGGAYVPLEPSYPVERLKQMIEDGEVALVLSRSKIEAEVGLEAEGMEVLKLDEEWGEIEKESGEDLEVEGSGDSLAYVMYTSGSTGKPKGVAVTHRGVVRLVKNADYVKLDEEEVILQYAPMSFDAATFEIWGALLNGGRLAIAKAGRQTLEELGNEIESKRVSTMWLTSALFQQMVENNIEGLKGVRQLVAGGDVLPVEQSMRVVEELKGCRLTNGYGPTEGTTFTCTHEVRREERGRHTIPIGKPIGNTRVYILGKRMEVVGEGVPGEIYIAGDGLARGYWNEAELTAERFVPDLYSEVGGERLYKTGDVGRYGRGGEIEFIGRIDEQVKIRGLRIEPGEIQATIEQYAGVSDCVVVAREQASGEKRLVAYVVKREASELSVNELRSFLRSRLPEYMMPSSFVMLEQLPLTPNGKVDRRALPNPDRVAIEPEATLAEPETPIQEMLAAIWCEVLETERVGIHSNFFDLGGHSLSAMQVISRLKESFGVDVELRSLFEGPTIAELEVCIEQASRALDLAEVPRIERVSRDTGLPLSYSQQRLWFLDQLSPNNSFYNIHYALELTGDLDIDSLRKALNEIDRRHEVLRTSFHVVEGQPVQVIGPAAGIDLRVEDLSGLSGQQREAETQRLILEDSSQPFNLTTGPMVRATLLELRKSNYILLLTMHHIASDGWSMQIFIRELTTLYTAFREGKESPLPEPAVQFADFAVWQRNWLQGEVLEEQIKYWKQQLGEAPPFLALPTDRPRPPVQSYRGAYEKAKLSDDLGERVERLSRQEGVTIFMTLLAGFKLLLSRYSAQEEISVGTPIANRNRAETESLMGFFVNTLVIRTDLRGEPSFRDVIGRVGEVCLGAYAHQDIPFEKLVDELEPSRDLSHTPLFQVMFAYEKDMPHVITVGGIELKWLEAEATTAKFDLTLSVAETARGLMFGMEYNTDLFDATSIARMMAHYENLLEAAASEPDRRIWELEILSAREREEVLVEWNRTSRAYASDSIQKQFYEQAAKRAPEVALDWDDGRMTYEELNRNTNRLARYLKARGVGEETRVGICEERGPWMVVEMLATLKAGAAYVPLEPSYPRERLRQMIEDAEVALILSSGEAAGVVEGEGRVVVKVDEQWEQIARCSDENLEVEGSPQSLAYVIYTSGSTGKPKAVGVSYEAMLNHLNWIQEAYPLSVTDRVVQKYPFSFDVSIVEFFCPLLTGARLVIARPDGHKDTSYLADLIAERGITTIDLVPTLLRALLDEERFVSGNSLRRVISGGEFLPSGLQELFFGRMTAELHNLYGPTEATIGSTFYECKSGVRGAVPIGRPIANTQVYILDRHLQPLPVGVTGELYIGGMGLARGYINDASLTAEKFMPDPFAQSAGSRLYRSGDLARRLASGEIEYCGRVDHQVKIRGFRIELAEIEAAIAGYPGVHECAVIAGSLPEGQQRLLAYVVLQQGIDLQVRELRSYLSQILPDYMVPNSYSVLECIPLDANGKVDQRALPEPEGANRADGAPRTPIEEILAGIWSEVLAKEQVGVDENFFEIGGNSLLATRVNSWIGQALGIELNVRTLFESPTIREFGERIEGAMRDPDAAEAPRIERTSREGGAALSFAQQRLWFLNQLEPDSPFYNVPFGVRLAGHLDVSALERSLSEIVRRHEVLRTTFTTRDGEPVQVVAAVRPTELPIVDLTGLADSKQADETTRLSECVSQGTFDITVGPLLRTVVLKLGEQDHVALMTMHHLVSDEWSMGVLVKEIAALYEAYVGNRPSPLPELRIQYSDFAVWQRQWLQGEVLDRQLLHWKKQLQDMPPPLKLSSRARPERDSYRRAAHQIELSESLSHRLKKLCAREKVTLFMTMLAAFKVLLYRYSGQEQIVVGAPIANRNRAEIEALIGFFINTLVLKTDLGGDPSFSEVLTRVKDVCLGAYAHQDVPFERLVDELAPERSLSYAPLFQVMFVLQNTPISSVELPGLTITPVKTDTGAAMFDLILIVIDAGESLQGMLLYNTDLFDPSTVSRIAEHYVTVIEEAVEDPGIRIIDIPISSDSGESRFNSATNLESRYEVGSFDF